MVFVVVMVMVVFVVVIDVAFPFVFGGMLYVLLHVCMWIVSATIIIVIICPYYGEVP